MSMFTNFIFFCLFKCKKKIPKVLGKCGFEQESINKIFKASTGKLVTSINLSQHVLE